MCTYEIPLVLRRMRLPWFAFLLVICCCSSGSVRRGSVAAAPDGEAHRIVHQNRYYARPGMSNEVYEWRLHACDVLKQLGLHSGHVFRGAGDSEPDAVWQIELDPETAAREGRIAQNSPAFQEVMKHMGTLIRRFEHSTFREERLIIDEKAAAPPNRAP